VRCRRVPLAVVAAILGAALWAPGVWGAAATGAPAAAVGPNSGVIRGRVVDETLPVHPVAGQLVRLQIVERGSSSERQTRTGARGEFVFTGLPVGGLRVFLVSTEYERVSYDGGQRAILTADAPVRDVPLTVYDATSGRGTLRGVLVFAVVDVAPGALRVTTVEQVQNAGPRTIVPTRAEPVVFPLPPEAVDVQPLDGWQDPRVEDGRLTDTRPLPPGVVQLTYAYQERPVREPVPVEVKPPFGAARVEVLVSDAHLDVTATGLSNAGMIIASGRRYVRWSGGPIAPGSTLTLRLGGLPAGGDGWPGAAAGTLALVLAAGLVWTVAGRGVRSRARPKAFHAVSR